MPRYVIETFDLSKKYDLKHQKKDIIALNNVNIKIRDGEIFGLLGPNGAGKTTMMKILTTLVQPTSGYATLDGFNILKNYKKTRLLIGLMLDQQMLYYRITGYDNLKFNCKLYNIPDYKEKIRDIAIEFGLQKWLNQYVHNYSTGMKMKLAFCRTILIDRKFLFLDEPTFSLDVNSKAKIIKKLKNLNKTIFLSSHDMNVVEKLCDRIAFINKGKIVKVGTKDDISKFIKNEIKIEISLVDNRSRLKSELIKQEYISEIADMINGFVLRIKNRENLQDLLSILSKYKILKINEQSMSLEDLFLKMF